MMVDLATFETLNRCNVSEMEKVGNSLSPENPTACDEFRVHLKKVEAALIHTYSLVAYLALYQKNPIDAAELWKFMSKFSDLTINTLKTIKGKFPYCGAPELYDLALDYKLASDDRHQQNTRDAECLTLTIPPNLFPKRNS
ncbi:MAG: hypothetical protein JWM99_4863 [Verrucomicrobiales bacterium]|nr:hypothetical protein [Verrucomicrobiales bacterium]